jgi:hypothetical protein
MMAAVMVAAALVAVVPSSSGAVEKRFSVDCAFSHSTRQDPIVSPGLNRRSDHDHVFFGNHSTASNSTYRSMRRATSSCELKADKAGYWVPALVDEAGRQVKPRKALVYYRSVGALADVNVRAFPKNLRIISHDFHFHCGEDRKSAPAPVDCSSVGSGQRLRLTVVFPSCWDGKRKDSRDHMRHMAFPSGKGCPARHPVAVPRLAIIAHFDVQNASGYRLSSGSPTTAHGDFWNTWRQRKLRELVHECLGRGVDRLCGQLST